MRTGDRLFGGQTTPSTGFASVARLGGSSRPAKPDREAESLDLAVLLNPAQTGDVVCSERLLEQATVDIREAREPAGSEDVLWT